MLVAISIAWIPLIQGMNNGQLFIYIQAVSAYLSPPIAMVFCMAVAWRRMTESGAFWGLMTGLAFGLVRMLLDFSYPSPLCMEVDARPAVVSHFHYMYFAAALFWTTGIVTFVVSLATKPGEDYRVREDVTTKLRSTSVTVTLFISVDSHYDFYEAQSRGSPRRRSQRGELA